MVRGQNEWGMGGKLLGVCIFFSFVIFLFLNHVNTLKSQKINHKIKKKACKRDIYKAVCETWWLNVRVVRKRFLRSKKWFLWLSPHSPLHYKQLVKTNGYNPFSLSMICLEMDLRPNPGKRDPQEDRFGDCISFLRLLSQTMWFKTIELYSVTVMEARSVKSRCPQGWFLVEALRGNLFNTSPTSWFYPQSLTFLGFQLVHSSLCLHLHMTFFPVCLLCFSVCSHDVLVRKLVISFEAHPN